MIKWLKCNFNFKKCQIITDEKKHILYDTTGHLTMNGAKYLFKKISKIKNKKFTILFSPAAASFDEYKNFEERGTMFKKEVFEQLKSIDKWCFHVLIDQVFQFGFGQLINGFFLVFLLYYYLG